MCRAIKATKAKSKAAKAAVNGPGEEKKAEPAGTEHKDAAAEATELLSPVGSTRKRPHASTGCPGCYGSDVDSSWFECMLSADSDLNLLKRADLSCGACRRIVGSARAICQTRPLRPTKVAIALARIDWHFDRRD